MKYQAAFIFQILKISLSLSLFHSISISITKEMYKNLRKNERIGKGISEFRLRIIIKKFQNIQSKSFSVLILSP